MKPSPSSSIAPRIVLMTLTMLSLAIAASSLTLAAENVTIEEKSDRLRVTIGDDLFTEYIFRGHPRPILYPIIGPYGIGMTRNYPMRTDVEGEAHDHVHHRSLWYAHRPINGVDFWSEFPEAGKTVQEKIVRFESGGPRGIIETANQWIAVDGRIVFTDSRTLAFQADEEARMIDYSITLKASHGDLTFGDSKEGTMAIRTHPNLNLENDPSQGVTTANGHAITSEGIRDMAVWGKRANWIDYWGQIADKTVGIAIFDHPSNPRHPTHWMARGYGYIGANPFGLNAFEGKPLGTGDMTIKAGQEVTFRYRYVFHQGDYERARITQRYEEYAK